MIQSLKNILPQYVCEQPQKLQNYLTDLLRRIELAKENVHQNREDAIPKTVSLLKEIKKLTLVKESRPVEILLSQNLQGYLYDFIKIPELQNQVMEILCNVVFFGFSVWSCLVQNDDSLCQIFLKAFLSQNEQILEGGLVGLGNICIDFPLIRGRALQMQFRQSLQTLLSRSTADHKRLQQLIWLINIFCQPAEEDALQFSQSGIEPYQN